MTSLGRKQQYSCENNLNCTEHEQEMVSEDSVLSCSERTFEDLKRQMNVLTNLSKFCSWNNWDHSLILSEDITILAIYSNGVDLGKKIKVRKPEDKQENK